MKWIISAYDCSMLHSMFAVCSIYVVLSIKDKIHCTYFRLICRKIFLSASCQAKYYLHVILEHDPLFLRKFAQSSVKLIPRFYVTMFHIIFRRISCNFVTQIGFNQEPRSFFPPSLQIEYSLCGVKRPGYEKMQIKIQFACSSRAIFAGATSTYSWSESMKCRENCEAC